MIEIDLNISKTIIDDINSLDRECSIVAYNNDVTIFQIVFYVLRTVVPLSDDEAYEITLKIHKEGKATVYTGNKEHCHKIGDALKKINVEYEIIN